VNWRMWIRVRRRVGVRGVRVRAMVVVFRSVGVVWVVVAGVWLVGGTRDGGGAGGVGAGVRSWRRLKMMGIV